VASLRGVGRVAPALLVVALVPGLSGPSGAAAPTCQGRRATIVGHPGSSSDTLRGTAGDDVIVTRGIGSVRAGAGADRICVTGTNSSRSHYVDAGTGDDRVVVATSRPDRVEAELGEGDDTFRGGAGTDFVHGEAPVMTGQGVPEQVEGRDRISTGGGDDEVRVGLAGESTRDVVDLGPGADLLGVDGLLAPDVRPRGGGGSDDLRLRPDLPGHAWAFDNVSETARLDGAVQSRWDGFEGFLMDALDASTVSFAGGSADERVSAPRTLARATLGAGNDSLYLLNLPDDHLVQVRGGIGRDLFYANAGPDVTVDLTAGAAWSDTGSANAPDARLAGFENAGGAADRVHLVGDAADNLLDGAGCEIRSSGGSGADRIRSTWIPDQFACDQTESAASFSGGPGRDVLSGGAGRDRLLGGPGHDTADGHRGRDLCHAEVRRSCELR
jgi:Ca2+-binding RTX toxin-like protein